MDVNERALARILFKNKILESDGQRFEDLFTSIMNYYERDFIQIKPWGNIGDRKNDGYIKSRGIFFQVFAPEDIRNSYPAVVTKAFEDFQGLKNQWDPVNEYYFVVNDKYKGVNADSEKCLAAIKRDYHLNEAGFLTAKDLENHLFELDDDAIISVVGFLPDPKNITTLDYSVIAEVIDYISSIPVVTLEDSLVVPDWDEKIKFNGLCGLEQKYLENGFLQVSSLEKYLNNNSNFLSDELKNKVRSKYLNLSKRLSGKGLFWEMVNSLIPRQNNIYQSHVIVIISKYFETCDVFEEPENVDTG
jgi:hypothetical protein